MAIDVTSEPGKTMKRLADALQARQSRLEKLTSYLEGDAPLPAASQKLKAAYREFQERARMHLAPVIVRAPQQRMIPIGWRIEGSKELDDEAARWWSVNEMGRYSAQVHGDMLGRVWGYVMVGAPDKGGVPVITREDPLQCITEHDPLRPSIVTAALKMFRDTRTEMDYAYLYLPGQVIVASRKATPESVVYNLGNYEFTEYATLPIEQVPIVCFENDGPVPGTPMAEFEPYLGDIDRINETILDRLVITKMQAYRQRALIDKSANGDALPETEKGVDAEGNEVDVPIDYAARFMPGVGRFFMLPQNTEIWESQPTDITPIIQAVKEDVRYLASQTGTPLPMLLPDAQNQSGEGARGAMDELYAKVRARNLSAGYGWNKVMQLAFAFTGRSVNVETEFMPGDLITITEQGDAWSKMPDLPFETKCRDILRYTPDKIERVMQERLSDALSAILPAGENGGV